MSLWGREKETVYPFSGFDGQVLFKGKPAAGAVLTRSYNQMGAGKVKDSVTADDQGRFRFQSIALEYTEPRLSAVDYLSRQDIFVAYAGEDFLIWSEAKRKREEYAEMEGERKVVVCEVTAEPVPIERDDGVGLLVTNCVWQNQKAM